MIPSFIIAASHIGIILGPVITICCIVVKCRQHCCFKVMVLVSLGIEISLCIPVAVLAILAQNDYKEKEAQLLKLNSLVQGCMDSYSFIPQDIIEEQIKNPAHYGEIAAILLTVFAGLVILKYVIVLILTICIRIQSNK